MNTKELIKNITEWNPYCEHITLATIFSKMKNGKGKCHVITFGKPGTGKSRSTLELIEALDHTNTIVLDNTTTDKGLFDTIMEYPTSDIILDECSTLLKNKGTQDMVKSILEGKCLTWTKDGSSETTDPYTGNIIINANVKIDDAVVDRSLMNKTMMNKKMNIDFNNMFIEGYMEKKDNSKFLNHIKKIIDKEDTVKLVKEEVMYILNFVNDRIRVDEKEEGYSRRIILRLLMYFEKTKNLFGSLDDEVKNFIEPYAETYIMNANSPGLIENILGSSTMEKANLVKKMSEETGWSKQHVRKLVNKEIETGKLNLKGKLVSIT